MKIRISASSYLYLLMASIAFAFTGLIYYFHQNQLDHAKDQALDQAAIYSSISARTIDAFMTELRIQAHQLALNPELGPLLNQPVECNRFLNSQAIFRSYDNIIVYNTRGQVACSAYSSDTVPSSDFYPLASKSETGIIGDFYQKDNLWHFPVGISIPGGLGAVVLVLPVAKLEVTHEALVDHGAEISFIDAHGVAGLKRISHSNMSYGEKLSSEEFELVRKTIDHPTVNAQGDFIATSNILNSAWVSFVKVQTERVYEPLHDAISHQTTILAVLSLFALLAIWSIANRLSAAASVLVKAAGNAESLFSSRVTGVSEIDKGIAEMQRVERERGQAQAAVNMWKSASDRTRSGMAILRAQKTAPSKMGVNFSLIVEICNPSFEELSGLGSCVGKDLVKDSPPMSIFGDKAALQELKTSILHQERASRPCNGSDSHGRLRHIQLSLEPLGAEMGRDHFCITLEDVTEIAAREAELEKQSTTDSLTLLPNRALFTSLLSKSLALSQRNGSLCAVALLDLDHFKFINDSIGHEMGDRVIAEVASRLSHLLRPGDTVSRFGGDEFGIIFADVSSLETIASLVEHCRESLDEPILMAGHSFALTFSAGVSVYPDDGDHPNTLMSCADIAMFQAKEHGRGNVKFHSKNMSESFSERLKIEQALKTALAEHSINFLYQPKIDLETGQPCGMEALARWNHPVMGDVSPAKFIPLAEESELIATLGNLAIHQALKDAKTLWDEGFRNMPVAINVSARQIKEGFTEKVVKALEDSGLPAQAVHVEITESSVMPNSEVTQKFLAELHRLGIKVALDDFGTGWSNMAMLKTLPLSFLKMDRSFIIGLGKDDKDAAIAKAIIGLAKALGVKVIAEGVETHMQAQQLVYLKADQIQGYYVCKPMSIQDVSLWLHGGYVFQGATSVGPSGSATPLPSIAQLSIQGPDSQK